jgi:hypothetical protein
MTYHHRQRPPAYILLETEPGDGMISLDGEIEKRGTDVLLTFWRRKRGCLVRGEEREEGEYLYREKDRTQTNEKGSL